VAVTLRHIVKLIDSMVLLVIVKVDVLKLRPLLVDLLMSITVVVDMPFGSAIWSKT